MNPRGKNAPSAVYEKWKNTPGVVGIKAHSFWHHFKPVELAPVARELAKTGKPLLIHVGFGEEGDFYSLLKEVPDLKLILAHAGFPVYRETWERIKGNKNVYVDLSQTSYVGNGITKAVVGYLGVERCLFGTDGPFGFYASDKKFDYGFIKRRLERLFPDKGVKKKLLGENVWRRGTEVVITGPPRKRVSWATGNVGSNPTLSAILHSAASQGLTMVSRMCFNLYLKARKN